MAKHLQVKAKRNGYRRAGRAFSDKEATYIPLADLKKEHLAALKEDPHLIVAEADPPEAEKPAKGAGKDGDK